MFEYLIYAGLIGCCFARTPIKRIGGDFIKAEDDIDYRLPTSVVPNEYEILLQPYFTNFTFSGYVRIKVSVVEETSNITLHAAEITFDTINVYVNENTPLTISNQTYDETREFHILHFDANLVVDWYTIDIWYTGILNGNLNGFYRSNYTNAAGEIRHLATTQFEPTDARRAFPCFDEPALKANFTIGIVRQEGYSSIANMPLNDTSDFGDGLYLDRFETSVKMSTYLVAFIVSDFEFIEEGRQRVYSRPEYINNGDAQFALDCAIGALSALEEYTQVNYSLSKMYQVSLPHFSAGAMENWGLVTYRETGLIFNKTRSSTSQKQSIEVVIAHEYVHQWFGDLVSPRWWSYLWLNEGFASFLQYYIGDKVKPQWRLIDQLVTANIQSVMATDALATTRPMTTDAGSPREINNLFDSIAYGKSGAVLRMLQHAITEDVFRNGLTRYLTARQYDAADSSDLWNNVQDAVPSGGLPNDVTILSVMRTWETQSGYPVVSVTRNYDNGLVVFSQERFLLYDTSSNDTTRWYVPINFATANNLSFHDTAVSIWLYPNFNTTFGFVDAEDWIIANKQAAGYYRINYDERNWELIAAYLESNNHTNIHPLNRAQLIDDAFNLARSGRLNYSIAMQITNYLHKETDYIPLSSFFRALSFFYDKAAGTSGYAALEARFAEILDSAVENLGVSEHPQNNDDEEHVNNLNRLNVLTWACRFGNTKCRNLTKERLTDISSISLDLQSTVLCAGLRDADQALWSAIYDRSLTEQDSTLRSALTSALGCSENEGVLQKYIEDSLNSSNSVFSNIYGKGNFGANYVFNYLRNNLAHIHTSIGTTRTSTLITGIASYLTTDEHLNQLRTLANGADSELATAFTRAISTVESNLEWNRIYLKDIDQWITDKLAGSSEEPDGAATFSFNISILFAFALALVFAR